MVKIFALSALTAAAMLALAPSAVAKRYLHKTLIGGVAGHYAGATAGCVIKRHRAKKGATCQPKKTKCGRLDRYPVQLEGGTFEPAAVFQNARHTSPPRNFPKSAYCPKREGW